MLSNSEGKLMVYASTFADHSRRLRSISSATEKMARTLNLNFKVVTFRKKFTPIYVYYKNGDEESTPLFCEYEGESDTHQVCKTLRNMLFVLSFHPKNSALRDARKEIMQSS